VVDTEAGAVFDQDDAGVRFDWGPTGAAQLSSSASCLVVVDVLSFTTAVSVVVGRGTAVIPCPSNDDGAEALAASSGARLAVPRRQATTERPWTLSPVHLANTPYTARLVLPSPNGSAIAAHVGGPVVAACLRNAPAVGRWLVGEGYGTAERPVAVVAAGERWSDGSLRPALEDALGAGAVLAALGGAGCRLSVEAAAVADMYRASDDVGGAVRGCGSARQLRQAGFDGDVEAAAALGRDDWVPVLHDGAFGAAHP